MATAQIMATAVRRHPAMKTRFRFRFRLVAEEMIKRKLTVSTCNDHLKGLIAGL